jgi:hypothetical protein
MPRELKPNPEARTREAALLRRSTGSKIAHGTSEFFGNTAFDVMCYNAVVTMAGDSQYRGFSPLRLDPKAVMTIAQWHLELEWKLRNPGRLPLGL